MSSWVSIEAHQINAAEGPERHQGLSRKSFGQAAVIVFPEKISEPGDQDPGTGGAHIHHAAAIQDTMQRFDVHARLSPLYHLMVASALGNWPAELFSVISPQHGGPQSASAGEVSSFQHYSMHKLETPFQKMPRSFLEKSDRARKFFEAWSSWRGHLKESTGRAGGGGGHQSFFLPSLFCQPEPPPLPVLRRVVDPVSRPAPNL